MADAGSQTPLRASSCGFESHLRHHHRARSGTRTLLISVPWLTDSCRASLVSAVAIATSSGREVLGNMADCSPGGVQAFRGPLRCTISRSSRARLGRIRTRTADATRYPVADHAEQAFRRFIGYPTDSLMAVLPDAESAAAAAAALRAAGIPDRDITILRGDEGADRLDGTVPSTASWPDCGAWSRSRSWTSWSTWRSTNRPCATARPC